MELQVNVAMLFGVALAWGVLTSAEPSAALPSARAETLALMALEDEFSRRRSDPELAERLADAYLAAARPDLVIAAVSQANERVQLDPDVAHRLARAFETSGRVEDALATAQVAIARCARSLGTRTASASTPLPERACSERTYASLAMHRDALGRMRAWGIRDPAHDPRTELAYSISVRSARILSATAANR